jgi:CheY-like chemotaxis protein
MSPLDLINLLLADDDADDAYFFREAIKGFSGSVNVITVRDGEQLMNYLNENINKLPKLLFLDLNMPRKNGFDCLREIKSNQKLKGLPVIIYSTSDEKDVIRLLYQAGAQFYIQKPDNFSKLKLVIKKAIELAQEMHYNQPQQEKFVLTA